MKALSPSQILLIKFLAWVPSPGRACCYFPMIKVRKNILRKIYERIIVDRGGRSPIPGFAFRGRKSCGMQGRGTWAADLKGAGEVEAGARTERWRLPWSGRPETAQNER